MASEIIRQTPQQPAHISAEVAQAAATEFLLDHAGNQLRAGSPLLMATALRSVWVVPVHLTYIHTGPVGSVGVVGVDEETGQVIAWTPIQEMQAASRRLREANPDIDALFPSFIAANAKTEPQ
jgi:hypothetical protein